MTDTGTSGDRVRQAAIALFAERGFHGTGIRELAGKAGLSSASLYHYMGTKDQLLAEIMETALRRLTTAARLAADGIDDQGERLGTLVALHVLTHAERPAETRVVDNEVSALPPDGYAAVVRMRDEYEGLFDAVLAAGARSGRFHAVEPSLTRLALLEMCNGVARWYSPRGTLGVAALAEHFAAIALRTVDATQPHPTPDVEMCRDIVSRVWGA